MGFIAHEDWPARRCSGESCKQGRAECKTPEACRLQETAATLLVSYSTAAVGLLLAVACVVVVVVLSL